MSTLFHAEHTNQSCDQSCDHLCDPSHDRPHDADGFIILFCTNGNARMSSGVSECHFFMAKWIWKPSESPTTMITGNRHLDPAIYARRSTLESIPYGLPSCLHFTSYLHPIGRSFLISSINKTLGVCQGFFDRIMLTNRHEEGIPVSHRSHVCQSRFYTRLCHWVSSWAVLTTHCLRVACCKVQPIIQWMIHWCTDA